jgi:hypothetical protein
MQDDRCENCRYWLEGRDRNGGGKCRRRAPQVIAHTQGPAIQSVFPITAGSDWCGDWEKSVVAKSYLEQKDLVVLS